MTLQSSSWVSVHKYGSTCSVEGDYTVMASTSRKQEYVNIFSLITACMILHMATPPFSANRSASMNIWWGHLISWSGWVMVVGIVCVHEFIYDDFVQMSWCAQWCSITSQQMAPHTISAKYSGSSWWWSGWQAIPKQVKDPSSLPRRCILYPNSS